MPKKVPVGGAVRVKMVVALGACGQYTASGYNPPERQEGQSEEDYEEALASYAEELRASVIDTAYSCDFKEPIHCVWVEADVPRPVEQRVRGKAVKTEKVES